jgi:hypothetical protein
MDRYVYAFLSSSNIFSSTFQFQRKISENLISSTTSASCSTLISSLWIMFIKNQKQFLNSNALLLRSDLSISPLLPCWAPPTSSPKIRASFAPSLASFTSVHPSLLFPPSSPQQHINAAPSSFIIRTAFLLHSPSHTARKQPSHASHARLVLTTFQNDKIRRPHQWRWRLD